LKGGGIYGGIRNVYVIVSSRAVFSGSVDVYRNEEHKKVTSHPRKGVLITFHSIL